MAQDKLADGCYIRLPFEKYLKQAHRLGSKDKGRLWLKGWGWWWSSPHNPFYEAPQSTDEQIIGEALHAAMLEGLHAYESRFCVMPDKRVYENVLETIPQMKDALREAGARLGPTTGWKLEDWADAVEINLPDHTAWPNVLIEARRRMNGRKAIPAEEDFNIRAMRSIALKEGEDNRELRELMSVGTDYPIYAELSVLYTCERGLQHRARFDKLVPVVTGDLKSIAVRDGRDLVGSVDSTIKDLGYDVQLADYHVARQHMNRMLLDGEHNLHGGTEEERTYLMALARWNQENPWAWLWTFFQKPSRKGAAPVILPLREPWRGSYHLAGYRKRNVALDRYEAGMRIFGSEQPWGEVLPVHWTDEGAPHHIPVNEFHWGPADPAPGEEDHFAARA